MEANHKSYVTSTALKWGILISIISVIIFTVVSMFLMGNMGIIGTAVVSILSFLLILVLLGVMATQIRKSVGGYMTLRETFRPIFIAILIMVTVTTVYNLVYVKWIDPTYYDRIKESTINASIKIGGDDDEEASARQAEEMYEKRMEDKDKPTSILLGFAGTIVVYSLFGFIVAAIVKRNPPEHASG